jgi:uncharacterized damage-inducible protein DinB
MEPKDLLVDAYGRIAELVERVLRGADQSMLTARIEEGTNSIAWLVWHLTRIQDDHIADVADSEQVWIADGFAQRCGLPFDQHATGYGHGPGEVAAVTLSAELLGEYHSAVHARTVAFLETVTPIDLERIVDTRWDPPVTLGVRLVSVISDNLQHAGQAAFTKGILQRS